MKRKYKRKHILFILLGGFVLLSAFPVVMEQMKSPIQPTVQKEDTPIQPIQTVALKPADSYEVRGIDVSRYQGDIDWYQVASEGIHFAYMKATEGTTHVDKNFDKNFANASKVDIKIGAYHFLSYDSTGSSQADNFIAKVPKKSGMLPPMIDIEFDPATVLPDQEVSDQIIRELIQKLEQYYGVKPVLYVNYDSYDRFVRGKYQDYPIWICDINKPAEMPEDQPITLWQYSHTGRLQGVNKGNSNVDLDVYTGSMTEFLNHFLIK